MDPVQNHEPVVVEQRRSPLGWIIAGVIVIAAVCVFAYGDTHRQQQTISQLTAHESDMNSTISQLQNQLSDVTNKLNDVQAQESAQATNEAAAKAAAAHAKPDPRWNKVQNQLSTEQQQLASEQDALNNQQTALTNAQNSIDQTRSDLQGTIDANHSELSGSIARTHDELVALEQRGERNYDEFDLKRGKDNHFYRVGPISLALRKADTKHKQYNVAMVVDDNQIQKKNVDLYEPIWLRTSDDPQPIEIVVNKIDKDHIHGYVSSSKYNTQAQVTPTSAPANQPMPQTPAASPASAPTSNPQSN
jgi:chromosome segregation ATPase